ncbi:MAG: hypothetical protein WCO42_01610 [bacterium]
MPELRHRRNRDLRNLTGLLATLGVLATVFAKVEIQIEGAAGWAANLPTWRLEHHWVLDLIWGGRPLTGYHVWVFLFMALVFHLMFFIHGRYAIRLELRVLGSLAVFWILEDFLWFVMNPAYGLSRFNPQCIPWHHHWMLGIPVDYVVYLAVGILMLWLSIRRRKLASRPVAVRDAIPGKL